MQDPENLRQELARAGLKDIRVETITEKLEFQSGQLLWDWLTNSNPIVGIVLAEREEMRRHIVAIGYMARLALTNSKTRMGSSRSPERTRCSSGE